MNHLWSWMLLMNSRSLHRLGIRRLQVIGAWLMPSIDLCNIPHPIFLRFKKTLTQCLINFFGYIWIFFSKLSILIYVMTIEDKKKMRAFLYMQYRYPEIFHLSEHFFFYYALFISRFYFNKTHVVKICSNASMNRL